MPVASFELGFVIQAPLKSQHLPICLLLTSCRLGTLLVGRLVSCGFLSFHAQSHLWPSITRGRKQHSPRTFFVAHLRQCQDAAINESVDHTAMLLVVAAASVMFVAPWKAGNPTIIWIRRCRNQAAGRCLWKGGYGGTWGHAYKSTARHCAEKRNFSSLLALSEPDRQQAVEVEQGLPAPASLDRPAYSTWNIIIARIATIYRY